MPGAAPDLQKTAAPLPGRETFLRNNGIIGSPAAVADKIRRFAEVAGSEFHFIARLYWPGMNRERRQETMHTFADSVIPLLQ